MALTGEKSSGGLIRVIVKRPGEIYGHWTGIPNELKAFQKVVDGPIEVVRLEDGIVLICNEEGKNRKLPFNCWLPNGDYIVGTALICGTDGDEFADMPIEFPQWRDMAERLGLV